MMPQFPSKEAPWDLIPFSQSPPAAQSCFPESWSEISSLSKVILVLGKARSHRAPNLVCRKGDWVTWVIWCFAENLCTRQVAWVETLSWWSCQSPVAHSCGLLNHLNSFCGGMFKHKAIFDADSLLYSLSHFECEGHTVHMLTQWHLPPPRTSTVKSSLFMHTHPSPLSLATRLHWCCANPSGYINSGWTFSRQTS